MDYSSILSAPDPGELCLCLPRIPVAAVFLRPHSCTEVHLPPWLAVQKIFSAVEPQDFHDFSLYLLAWLPSSAVDPGELCLCLPPLTVAAVVVRPAIQSRISISRTSRLAVYG
jgi:hypothetical protein